MCIYIRTAKKNKLKSENNNLLMFSFNNQQLHKD